MSRPDPPRGCSRCPRLVAYRRETRGRYPEYWAGAVPSFGDPDARVLIVGLAPGLHGAHRTGRAFTGDSSGLTLFDTLDRHGFLNGAFGNAPDDGLRLNGVMITNAVRCLPPRNRPLGAEISNCRPFLQAQIAALPALRAILCLGRVAHDVVIRSQNAALGDHPFAHGARHEIAGLSILDSYHPSRYNMNTRRLTPAMFDDVVAALPK